MDANLNGHELVPDDSGVALIVIGVIDRLTKGGHGEMTVIIKFPRPTI